MKSSLECSMEPLENGVSVARLTGRLDISSAAEMKQVFTTAIAGGSRRLIVDLEGVAFVDSSGLSALVSGLRIARQSGGDLRIAAAGDQPTAIFSLTSLDQVFRLHRTVQEAIDGYRD